MVIEQGGQGPDVAGANRADYQAVYGQRICLW